MAQHEVEVTLITKPGCHLCDEARPILDEAIAHLRGENITVSLTEQNMLEDERLVAEYQEDIPVVLIDGKRHSYWHIDRDRFIEAVRKRHNRGLRGLLRKHT